MGQNKARAKKNTKIKQQQQQQQQSVNRTETKTHLDVAEGRIVAEHLDVDHADQELLHLLPAHRSLRHLPLQHAHLPQRVKMTFQRFEGARRGVRACVTTSIQYSSSINSTRIIS